jgi:hypothetical protein
MQKRLSFWTLTAIALGVWLSIVWIVQASQQLEPAAIGIRRPLQQACNDSRADLRIQEIRINSRGIGQPFDVRVEIINDSTGDNGLQDSWSYVYVDRSPSGNPDGQAFAPTARLASEGSINANFTVTSGFATVGWHTVSVVIDATNLVTNEGCGGENNNERATSFEIKTVQPTDTPPPTPTSFAPPQIYYFEPEEATIGRGDAVTLRWQVSGESISVTLDDEPVPVEAALEKYPSESHVYTLRAENPGGVVQKTSNITVADPTVTPTPTEAPCDYPIVHEFGASPSSVNRGERVTVFWDVERADQVFLNGEAVADVSAREFKIDRTTTFVLLARNACGDVEEDLTVQASFATPTRTATPTLTRTPTRTATPTATPRATRTPTRTPTRNVLPTRTFTATASPTRSVTPTATNTSSAFESPLGTPTGTAQATASASVTPTGSATSRATATMTAVATTTVTSTPGSTVTASTTAAPTASVTSGVPAGATATAPATVTPATATATARPTQTATATLTPTAVPPTATVDASGSAGGAVPTMTSSVGPSGPSGTPTSVPPLGTVRMYLCPLAVLLLFAVGVVILSIVVPRIQERQQDLDDFGYSASLYGVASSGDGAGDSLEASATPNLDARAPLPQDELPSSGISFDPDVSLLEDADPSEIISFDPLLDELPPPERQETEHASSTSE